MANSIFKSECNPYRSSIYQHLDRIFNFDSYVEDLEKVRQLLSTKERVYLEIGSGSGGHILERASKDQAALYLGFEIRYKRSVRTIEKAKRDSIENVYIARTNANNLYELVPANSISGIYINFPDPWPKERKKKNRFFSEKFLTNVKPLLKENAFIAFKTDHRDYFEYVTRICRSREDYRLVEYTEDLYASEYLANNVQSEFEKLFLDQELPIYYLQLALAQ